MQSTFKVSIVGKANVGKSTLFNKMAKQRCSITMDRKGVTRDVVSRRILLNDRKSFFLLDTAGFNPQHPETIERTEYAIKESDMVLFVIDNKIDSEDMLFASWIRKNAGNSKILLVCNKSDRKDRDDCSLFGFRDIFPISAEHSVGLRELISYIESFVPEQLDVPKSDSEQQRRIRVAILGQPNVGKSSLMNKFIGKDRVLVLPIAGTTRDPISDEFQWKCTTFELVDTAGLRKKQRVTDGLEKICNSSALRTSAESDVVLFMCDISNFTLERQDFLLMNRILEQGKPIILVGNKKDAVNATELESVKEFISLQAQKLIASQIPIFFISCLHESDFSFILDECVRLYDDSKRNIPTHRLNTWLQEVVRRHPHPMVNSKPVKLKYIKKLLHKFVFVLSANHPELVAESYLNYIRNSLIRNFRIYGIPVTLILKKNDNPYVGSGSSKPKNTQSIAKRGSTSSSNKSNHRRSSVGKFS
ncbi:ribosome biogenesis GTPase Der [Neorickettsia sp. 179522]|uniref:ribosome biogenesis GTPase Der n=1 Tax=Neorickettsia sp. 179522 TaxID=1714371 RepID=UPI0006097AA5|nr:ribosome biogenesis GTPase Der [Neorickettsia sp. 179522]KYH12584.1 ribosome-associated GTPase EngA [Neorickettsia sp. 179522]